jgi:hypothetical protein
MELLIGLEFFLEFVYALDDAILCGSNLSAEFSLHRGDAAMYFFDVLGHVVPSLFDKSKDIVLFALMLVEFFIMYSQHAFQVTGYFAKHFYLVF